jgi:hypothetical protein
MMIAIGALLLAMIAVEASRAEAAAAVGRAVVCRLAAGVPPDAVDRWDAVPPDAVDRRDGATRDGVTRDAANASTGRRGGIRAIGLAARHAAAKAVARVREARAASAARVRKAKARADEEAEMIMRAAAVVVIMRTGNGPDHLADRLADR